MDATATIEDFTKLDIRTGTIARAAEPEKVLVEARGLFVMPRPEKQAAYFGAITDASGGHAPPRRPGDATALQQG